MRGQDVLPLNVTTKTLIRPTNYCSDIADELNVGKSTVHTILTEHLELKKLCAKVDPKLLTQTPGLARFSLL